MSFICPLFCIEIDFRILLVNKTFPSFDRYLSKTWLIRQGWNFFFGCSQIKFLIRRNVLEAHEFMNSLICAQYTTVSSTLPLLASNLL